MGKEAINYAEIVKIELDDYKEYENIKWFDKPKGFIFKRPSGYYFVGHDGRALPGLLTTDMEEILQKHFDKNKYSIHPVTKQIMINPRVSIYYRGIKDPDRYYFNHYDKAETFYNTLKNKMAYCFEYEN